jgi:branched-subunit amino acid ABC-type transport system permease component
MVSDALLFALLGLGTGSLFAALALGVVVTYRGTGLVNFALGAQAMFPAIVYAELRRSGDLLLPVIVIPDRYELAAPMGLVPAAAIAIAIGALISAAAYMLIFRPLREAPPLTPIVAMTGLVIVLQALGVRSFGTRRTRTPSILPRSNIEILGRLVPVDRLWLSGIVLLVAVGLTLVYKHTRFGLASRAGASDEKGATLLGYNMVALGLVTFVLASVIVSAAGILLSMLGGVDPFSYTVFVMPALAAALAGRLQSFGWAAIGGLAIGSFQGLTVHLVSNEWVPSFFQVGLEALVPFGVIVVVLFAFGRTLPTRGVLAMRGRVSAPAPRMDPRLWIAIIGVGLLIAMAGDHGLRLGLIQSSWVTVLLLSMVLITGYLGQVSLVQLGVAGLAAYMLAKAGEGWGVPFPLSPMLAIAVATLVGGFIAVPALRIRGIQYAVATFAAAVVLEQFIFRNGWFVGREGRVRVEPPTLGGIEFGILRNGSFPSRTFTAGTVAFTALAALLVANIRRGGVGRRFLAVRMNERAAAAAGINVVRQKILGATIASFLASVAGVMYAYKTIELGRQAFSASQGLQYVALAFLGGIGTIAGALLGGFITPSGLFIAGLPWDHVTEDVYLTVGFGVILATRAFPSGLSGVGSTVARRMKDARWIRRPSSGSQSPRGEMTARHEKG